MLLGWLLVRVGGYCVGDLVGAAVLVLDLVYLGWDGVVCVGVVGGVVC